jgi:hypothetical protein
VLLSIGSSLTMKSVPFHVPSTSYHILSLYSYQLILPKL